MAETHFEFWCLFPRKKKKAAFKNALSSSGTLVPIRVPPMSFRAYKQTNKRAEEALLATQTTPRSAFGRKALRMLFKLQYNGARRRFEKHPTAVAVAWNGLNGTRRAFMDGAKDARNRRLYFELAPFPNRLTIDPEGVNFANSLPREIEPYLTWFETSNQKVTWRAVAPTIHARTPNSAPKGKAPETPMTEPFIFAPLQVPGDSQLRLFGGEFKTVRKSALALAEAARHLPDGWHLRMKEHPTAPEDLSRFIRSIGHPKLVLDNCNDTFEQVKQSAAVVTVNSSVGLEAMVFEKPVAAMGQCFWAIDDVALRLPTQNSLNAKFKDPNSITFDPQARNAFLSFLLSTYYPRMDDTESLSEAICQRLQGPDALGFWQAVGQN